MNLKHMPTILSITDSTSGRGFVVLLPFEEADKLTEDSSPGGWGMHGPFLDTVHEPVHILGDLDEKGHVRIGIDPNRRDLIVTRPDLPTHKQHVARIGYGWW